MEFVHILLNPLEFISSIEEPNIRETAIQSAKKLAVGQSEEFFTNHFYEMVKRLVMWDNYTSKISGTSLIPTCFRHLPLDKHPGLKSVVKELGKEDTPMVRRAVAGILSELCEIYDKESFKADLKPMLYLFLAEEIDSVKMKALEQMAAMAKYIDQDERDSVLLDFILKMDAGNKNWRIRYHLPDSLTSIIDTLCTLPSPSLRDHQGQGHPLLPGPAQRRRTRSPLQRAHPVREPRAHPAPQVRRERADVPAAPDHQRAAAGSRRSPRTSRTTCATP